MEVQADAANLLDKGKDGVLDAAIAFLKKQ